MVETDTRAAAEPNNQCVKLNPSENAAFSAVVFAAVVQKPQSASLKPCPQVRRCLFFHLFLWYEPPSWLWKVFLTEMLRYPSLHAYSSSCLLVWNVRCFPFLWLCWVCDCWRKSFLRVMLMLSNDLLDTLVACLHFHMPWESECV